METFCFSRGLYMKGFAKNVCKDIQTNTKIVLHCIYFVRVKYKFVYGNNKMKFV